MQEGGRAGAEAAGGLQGCGPCCGSFSALREGGGAARSAPGATAGECGRFCQGPFRFYEEDPRAPSGLGAEGPGGPGWRRTPRAGGSEGRAARRPPAGGEAGRPSARTGPSAGGRSGLIASSLPGSHRGLCLKRVWELVVCSPPFVTWLLIYRRFFICKPHAFLLFRICLGSFDFGFALRKFSPGAELRPPLPLTP